MASDRGSDLVAAKYFVKYHLKLNIDDVSDPSHDLHNDIKNAIAAGGLTAHNLLMCATWNVPHGPWSEDTRYRQVVDGMEDLREFESPSTSPLFQALALNMLKDAGEEHLVGTPDIEDELWRRLFEESPWVRKGSKMNQNRFLGNVFSPMAEDRHWTMRLFGYLHIALELDMLKGKAFSKILFPENALSSGRSVVVEDSATLRRPLPEEAVLRSACQHALVVAVLQLSNEDNRTRSRIIQLVCRPWARWHSTQNSELRDVASSGPWLARQIEGHLCV